MLIYVLKVLENTLIWLNDWEKNLLNKLITEDNFLTKNTAEGLRVTIKSTIDLINVLHTCGFDYVLTSKINQDCLEVNLSNICTLLIIVSSRRVLLLGSYSPHDFTVNCIFFSFQLICLL